LTLSTNAKKKIRTKIEDSLEFPDQIIDCKPVKTTTTDSTSIQIDPYEPFFNPHPQTLTPEATIRVEHHIDDRNYYTPNHTPPDNEWPPLPVSTPEKEPSKYIYDTFCEINNLFDVINSGFYNAHCSLNAHEYPYPDYYQRDYDDFQESQFIPMGMAVHTAPASETRIAKFHMPSDSQPVGLGFTYLDYAFQKKS